MGKSCIIMNQKGGIGKTTMTVHAAWELSRTKKVLVIDLDSTPATSSTRLGVSKKDVTYSIADILLKGVDSDECIFKVNPNLDVIPGANSLYDLDTATGEILQDALNNLKMLVEYFKTEYDYVFLDVPPSSQNLHTAAVLSCDNIYLVLKSEYSSIDAVVLEDGFESFFKAAKEANPKLKLSGVILNEASDDVIGKEVSAAAKDFADKYHCPISKIRPCKYFGHTERYKTSLIELLPKEKASQDLIAMLQKLFGAYTDRAEAAEVWIDTDNAIVVSAEDEIDLKDSKTKWVACTKVNRSSFSDLNRKQKKSIQDAGISYNYGTKFDEFLMVNMYGDLISVLMEVNK